MILAIGDIHTRIADREDVIEIMRATQAQVVAQAGCEGYVFAELLDDPGHFSVVQEWRDQSALDEHYRSQTFAEFQRRIGQHLVRTSELRIYEAQIAMSPLPTGPVEPAQDGLWGRIPGAQAPTGSGRCSCFMQSRCWVAS